MGTLSGGGKEVISIGERCLLGANAGIGISLGDDCVVEAGLYVTAGTKVTPARRPGGQGARAVGPERSAVHAQLGDRRDRGPAPGRAGGRAERRAARQLRRLRRTWPPPTLARRVRSSPCWCSLVVALVVGGFSWLRQPAGSRLRSPASSAAWPRPATTPWRSTLEQAHYASIIAGLSVTARPAARAASIAMATAYQESGIRNLDYGDRDSVGLFQQRPSQGWGTAKQIMDPVLRHRRVLRRPGQDRRLAER